MPARAAHGLACAHTPEPQDWLDADRPPSAALARCLACGDLMALVLQLNGELPERFPGHERRLYVFACRRSSCRRREGSIRVVRGVRAWDDEAAPDTGPAPEPAPAPAPKPAPVVSGAAPGLGETLFGAKMPGGGASGANPFSANPFSAGAVSSSPLATANPFASAPPAAPVPAPAPAEEQAAPSLSTTFAAALSLDEAALSLNAALSHSAPPAFEPWPAADAAQPKPYPTRFLADADYETLDPTPRALPANVRLEDADAPEPSMLDRQAFESTMDAAFQKFADRLAQNPDQVIRYEFGGVPLLYSRTDAVGARLAAAAARPAAAIPRCAVCAARRAFEVQLTPNAIAELEAEDLGLEGMEWGTVIVAVCERDCLPPGTQRGEAIYLEEWAGVQWEELAAQD